MPSRIVISFVLAASVAAAAACDRPARATDAKTPAQPAIEQAAPANGATHPDSIHAAGVHAFREGLTEPAGLRGGARTREALVRAFVTAVESGDTATMRALAFDRAEFAYLYYPSSRFTRAPYRTTPALLWFIIQNNGSKGGFRLLQQRGRRPLGYVGFRCPENPEREGENVVWQRCTVQREVDGQVVSEQLFGAIVQRGGRYKFLSYANEL